MLQKEIVGRPLRTLVIGAGGMATFMHLPIMARLRDRGEIELTLVCDIQRERAAVARKQFGFLEDTGDAASAVERPDIDAVYIFGTAQMHYAYGMRALRQRKHLFVEKPIAPSFAEARELAQAAQDRGLIAVGGHNRRFYRSLAALRAHSGRAGWRTAEAVFHKPMAGQLPLFGVRNWLAANGIHALDALVFMMGGLPDHVAAIADNADPDKATAFSAVMRWRDGRQASFLCNNSAGARREEYIFHGVGETYSVTEAELVAEKDGTAVKAPFPSGDDSFVAEHESFLGAVRDGKEPPHGLAGISPSLFLCELVERGFTGNISPPISRRVTSSRALEKAVLVVQPMTLQPALAPLMTDYRLVSLEDILKAAGECPNVVAAILGHGAAPLSQDILAKLPRLAVVGIAGLSFARYEPDALLARGITLVNASAAYAESVAEFALGLAILGRRRAFVSHENMRQGDWSVAPRVAGIEGMLRRAARAVHPAMTAIGLASLLGSTKRAVKPFMSKSARQNSISRELRGATVGLIGWGANARALAERLGLCSARVIVYSEHATEIEICRAGAAPASLGEVLAADIVSLHRGLNARTRHFLGPAELAMLRPGALLINIARGGLIDPEALITRLRQGDIFACLDTFEEEPLAAAHPLRTLPNVFLTSHIAGGSPDMHSAAAKEVVQKVGDYLTGENHEKVSAERLRNMT